MPSPNIKTIRDLIFYQYAKIIADSAGFDRRNHKEYFSFIMDRVNKLRNGDISMSSILREIKAQIKSTEQKCEYCQKTNELSWDHIIPKSKGGPDTADNLILCCKSCNSSKASKGIYDCFGLDKKDSLPRIIAGKYLKLLFEIHQEKGTLESTGLKGYGKLDVLDLEIY
jgi:5-methylcytosine-specific restriction endonuclease McrA